jgi:hypothetical protein
MFSPALSATAHGDAIAPQFHMQSAIGNRNESPIEPGARYPQSPVISVFFVS